MAKKLTEKEKLALADKMAFKLGKYIGGLDVKLSRSELSEENWNQEMDKHPLFTGKAGKGIKKYIKHDPKNITKEELTLKYKEDGNFYVKHMKFPMAVCIFTEGIKVKCEKMEVLAILYNNRSAANFFLTNYQAALTDAQRALKLKPDYEKSRWRAAQCAFHISDLRLAAKLSKEVLEKNESRPDMQLGATKLLLTISFVSNYCNFPINLLFMEFYKEARSLKLLCDTLKERRVKFDSLQPNEEITGKVLVPKCDTMKEFPIRFDMDGRTVVWPALFLIEEIKGIYIEIGVNENVILKDYLNSKLYSYLDNNMNVYYVKSLKGKTHKIDLKKTVKDIVTAENFYVIDATLTFHVVPAGSDCEKKFLKNNA